MNKNRSSKIAVIVAAAFAAGTVSPAWAADAVEILDRMDASMAFAECEMRISFEDLKASGASRKLGADIAYAKDSGTLIAFTAPAREKGKKMLMIGESMWMSVPGVSKPLRLSGKDAFMGTSFTNDDIMNFDKADDYAATIVASDDGAWTLDLAARKKSLPYQRARIVVGRDFLPQRQELYLLSGELAKTIEFSDPRDFGAKRRPATMRVTDAMSKGAATIVRFESILERSVDKSRLSPERFMR
jgi:outer membrane lipoprotein-sorting protein